MREPFETRPHGGERNLGEALLSVGMIMALENRRVFVEIVAKKKGCMLCDLALAVLEELAEELPEGRLEWTVVDVGEREGLARQEELKRLCGDKPPVPSLVINGRLAFDHIPEMGALSAAVTEAMEG